MLEFVCVAVLVAVQLGSFYGVSAIDALAPGSSFTAAMIDLRNAANVFATDHYNGPFPPNVTALEVSSKRPVIPSVDACDRGSQNISRAAVMRLMQQISSWQ
jgi:hypothetical protein